MTALRDLQLVVPAITRLSYLLRDEFTTAASGPLTSPRNCEPGPGTLTLVQVDANMSITGGSMVIPVGGTWNGLNFYSGSIVRKIGRTLLTSANVNTNSGSGGNYGLASNVADATLASSRGWNWSAISTQTLYWNGGLNVSMGSPVIDLNTTYPMAFMMGAAVVYWLVKISGTWTLLWIDNFSDTTVRVKGNNNSGALTIDYVRVRDLSGAFATETFYTLSQATPSGAYTGVADGVFDLTVTAPNPLADSAILKYRVQDANNYWALYLDSAGALKLDSVAAGVATNRLNVAGVATVGSTYTLRVIAVGAKHNVYLLSGGTWAKQGGEVNLSHMNTQTGIDVSAASYTASQVTVWPRTSAAYSQLDAV